ncbi:glycosyltransferase [Clostridium sp.]|uniref:glycosyltransferase n=1 Tax=Clostridium sp. TaxID=1506 RepID=UPI00261936C6|nr:glycosyltransferase [Clostridium sp.]
MEFNIAIIILNYVNYTITEKNVDNLIELGVKYPIIIVDNNSQNNSFENIYKKYQNFNYIYVIKNHENKGYASGNNFGVKFVMEKLNFIKYICIMNPDVTILYKEIFSNLKSKIEDREDIALIGAMMILNNELNSRNFCWKLPNKKCIVSGYFNFLSRFRSSNKKDKIIIDSNDSSIAKVQVVPGSFFIIKKAILQEIGLFDENTFLYNEENILSIKLRNKSYSECLSINDYYIHNHKKTVGKKNLKDKLKSNNVNFQSRKYLCKTYYDKRLVILLYIIFLFNIVEISLFHFISKIGKVRKFTLYKEKLNL